MIIIIITEMNLQMNIEIIINRIATLVIHNIKKKNNNYTKYNCL